MGLPTVGQAFLTIALLMTPAGLRSQATPRDATEISPKFRANLAKLLDAIGGRDLILQVLDMQINAIKPSLAANPNLTAEFNEEFMKEFRQRFLTSGETEIATENIYANYFTPAEVGQLIAATPGKETPLGQKLDDVRPRLTQDATQALRKIGLQIASETGKTISQQYPELLRNAAAPGEPVKVRQEWVLKNLVKRVEPEYPTALAKMARIQGRVELAVTFGVELAVTFGKDGSVRETKLVRGDPMLADASRQAVAQWKVTPLLQNGEPVDVSAVVILTFPPVPQ